MMPLPSKAHFFSRFLFANAAGLLLASRVIAGDTVPVALPPPTPTASDWEFRISLPFWIATQAGTVGARGVKGEIDSKVTDFASNLDSSSHVFEIPLSLEARYQRWRFLLRGYYAGYSDTITPHAPVDALVDQVKMESRNGLVEGGVGYDLLQATAGHLTIMAGFRYNYVKLTLTRDSNLAAPIVLPERQYRETGGWVDPFIGVSGKVKIWKPISFFGEGDVGGFGLSSKFSFQLQGGLEFQFTRHFYGQLGYKYYHVDYTHRDFTWKTETGGPVVTLGWNF